MTHKTIVRTTGVLAAGLAGLWLYALGQTAAQVQAVFDHYSVRPAAAAARRSPEPAEAANVVVAAPPREESLDERGEPLEDGFESYAEDALDAEEAEAGAPSASQFAELLQGGYLFDVEPEAADEFLRAYPESPAE